MEIDDFYKRKQTNEEMVAEMNEIDKNMEIGLTQKMQMLMKQSQSKLAKERTTEA